MAVVEDWNHTSYLLACFPGWSYGLDMSSATGTTSEDSHSGGGLGTITDYCIQN